ncbi:MAG: hypothetical protein DLM67_04460 [Candidatus Nephthysia bennettiae]|uniref:DUF2127 domain-containing protein n=1 Tax=Candidatus Nephthysia bennettiae TaxID=3127016 RepID=A0A934N9I2_9BACT|nr:hypothetical protein [Candidatus Dormibacteraeota bacterium]PZR99160.1 MAG: hypothetical protein DLM67_04460 [Candidatus Dormibacteraeota bacterium]
MILTAALLVFDLGARRRIPVAVRLLGGYLAARSLDRLALLGLTITATIHLALVPGHAGENPTLAALFALDGVALLAVILWALGLPIRGWQSAGLVVLAVGVVAYVVYLAAVLESPDAVGIATKLLELATMALLLIGWSSQTRRQTETPEKRRAAAPLLDINGGLNR